jgi:hypothetical protein
MNFFLYKIPGLVKRLPLLFLIIAVLMPTAESSSAQAVEVIVEDPSLNPAFTTCPETYWYPIDNDRGHKAYLTLNVLNPADSSNSGKWRPAIPQSGYYRVEAYIAGHPSINWCTNGKLKEHDTTDAHYSIHHANGVTDRTASQYPLYNQWLSLGEYYFIAGSTGYVSLTDLNGEVGFSTTVSFSAMRFTFTRLNRPVVYLPMVHRYEPPMQLPPNTGVIQAHGFDACHLPEISEMQTWWNKSPYRFYALYLGGISLYGGCARANSTWINTVHQQGWSFVPTWVGLQAPCSTWKNKMSNDPATAYQQGRQEAEAASAKAVSIGLTPIGDGGTVIYYDMEVYGGASLECRQTVASFMNGWVKRLHELGNVAGGYGSRNSYVADWATITNAPDDLWVASWYGSTYDPGASVNGITWLNGLWTNHQRIRQYTGSHNETWGSITFNIDSDVADGVVALPSGQLLGNPIVSKTIAIDDVGWLSADQGWLVAGNKLYWTNDQGENWQDISPAPIQYASFLPSGEGWAISVQNEDVPILYHTSDFGKAWEVVDFPLPLDGAWYPLQLQFSSPHDGWVVLQRQTSQAFNSAILMKTSDGGRTWRQSELPAVSTIQFVSPDEGWMANPTGDGFFHTMDGGKTWQPATPDRIAKSLATLPEGASLSGWQGNSLGWVVTTTGDCSGDKSTSTFTCQVDNGLQQSLDGGKTWQEIPLPAQNQVYP